MTAYSWGAPRYGRLLAGDITVDMGIVETLPQKTAGNRFPQLGAIIACLLGFACAVFLSLPSTRNSLPVEPVLEVLLSKEPAIMASPKVKAMAPSRPESHRPVIPQQPVSEPPSVATPTVIPSVVPVPAIPVVESDLTPSADAIVVSAPVGNGSEHGWGSGNGNGEAMPAAGNGLGVGNGVVGGAGMVDLDREPRLLGGPAPTYPESALDEGIEAVVVASVEISAEGKVQKIAIVKSGGRDFDKAVMAAARLATYAAPVIQGVAHPAKFIRTYRFELE